MITTMGGLSIKPDISLDECILESKDLLILPGGTTWSEEIHQPVLERIGQALKFGTIVAAICGATEALANMGYLDSRKHTSNDLEYIKMVCSNYKGEKFYEMRPAVSGENLITASGVAPLEFTMEVLKKLDVFAPDTLHSWYNLNKTHQPEYFFQLMNSINSWAKNQRGSFINHALENVKVIVFVYNLNMFMEVKNLQSTPEVVINRIGN